MNLVFFGTALTMILIALSFAVTPMVVSYRNNNSGFAKFPLLAIIVVIGCAIALYAAIGNPGTESQTRTAENPGMMSAPVGATTTGDKAASVETLLAGLEQRLSANPDDGKGWLLLAKSYEHMGKDADAADAYAKAVALGVTDEALGARLSANEPAAAAGAAEIRGHLRLYQSAADQIDPDDVVFITAKAEGNPMPLAVLRKSASELPFDFVLSDKTSMVKGNGISTASEIVVTAKVSKSGDALNTAENLQATVGPFDPDAAEFVELVLGAAATDTNKE